MQQIVNVTIDESGRSRASAKSIGIQYETGVAKFLVTPAPSWVNDDYFYYLIISPPEDSGNEQYAVPLINKGGVFEYQIGSGITWHVGNYKFAFIAMSEQLSSDGRVPTTGIVSISEAWTCNIESGILRLNELDKQPTDPNFTLLYDDLMALSVAVESKGNYAKTQGDYAKNIGDELKVKQEIGAFNGTPGSDGTSAGFGTPSAIVTTLEDNEDATVKVTASGEDTAKVFNFEFGIPKGAKGDKGEPGTDGINGTNGNDGANGKGIASIIRTDGTGEPGTIDTYTITYTDNTTSTYEVYNGKDGSNGEDGTNGTNGTDGITPHIGKNGNWWLDTVDTGVCATGGSYTLPKASADVLGGVKVGENLNITEDGTLNAQAGTEDVIIPYKTFTDYSDEEKTSIADKLLNCINAVKSLTKICYLEYTGAHYPLSGIINDGNNIRFYFILLGGFTELRIIYTVSTTSNTLINVTSNVYNLVDSAMSDTSTKPVQNKVIKSYIDNLMSDAKLYTLQSTATNLTEFSEEIKPILIQMCQDYTENGKLGFLYIVNAFKSAYVGIYKIQTNASSIFRLENIQGRKNITIYGSYNNFAIENTILTLSKTTNTISIDNNLYPCFNYLELSHNYSTPYEPLYAGSPVTKQYVDNLVGNIETVLQTINSGSGV